MLALPGVGGKWLAEREGEGAGGDYDKAFHLRSKAESRRKRTATIREYKRVKGLHLVPL